MRIFVGLLAALFWGASFVKAEDWRVYETRNFVVYSEESAKKTQAVAHELEQYRTYLVKALNIKIDMPDQLPLTVYMLKGWGRYSDVTGLDGTAGVFSKTPEGPIAVFYSQQRFYRYGQRSKQVMMHEYVHHVMRQQSTPAFYPNWYSEGMAEFLSTYFVRNNQAVLGDVLEVRLRGLRRKQYWFDMKTLLEMQSIWKKGYSQSRRSAFYSQAWLLTRMLFVDPRFRKGLAGFTADLSSGVPPEKALLDRFSISYEELDKKFYAHYKLMWRAYSDDAAVMQVSMPLPKTRIELMRKGLLSKTDGKLIEQMITYYFQHSGWEHKKQKKRSQKAYKKTGDTRFKLIEISALKDAGAWDEAGSKVGQALTDHPNDPNIHMLAGQYLIDRGRRETGMEEQPQALDEKAIQKARNHLKAVVEADDWNALARLYLADTYLIGDQKFWDQAAPYIRDAYALYPQYFAITRNYLDLLLHEEKYSMACQLLRPLYHLNSTDEYRDDMQNRLNKIPDQKTACPI